jgi:rare lipoprotein A
MSYIPVQYSDISPSVNISRHKWFLSVSLLILVCALGLSSCNSERSSKQAKQVPLGKESVRTKPVVHKEVGEASWYGPGFHGQETSSGETFDQKEMTAAHPSLPMGTKAEVTNLENGKKVEVRINDRGPYTENRVIDLSSEAANKLKMKKDGTAQVKIEAKTSKKRSRNTSSKKN